ncbi:RagB/SusD family nutrient uptake outer membrane protein [Tenacibaculum haliotis]|uniref:RagB/SusD family nutrient uptake outer membrane protein n=1 Tax=Tenacibaculum haliotis TaxID=1888914 RepID=UPI0021AFEA7F|nr:RagB/SusD family nutrient uptake outer membrane protein [Tenacibaculum haliotis]MCT4697865.1 RagB/SusD family nutrient uptake outer membrane protein [Tenacibaculum haliotis]
MKKIIYFIATIVLLGGMVACNDKDLDPTLAQDKDLESNVNTYEDLLGIINGAYNRISGQTYYGRDYIIINEVRSDNVYSNANSNRFVKEGQMDLLPTESGSQWTQIYRVIGLANIVINQSGIQGDATKINHLKGQAYAMRALAHFDLVKLYGQQHVSGGDSTLGVPYMTTFRDPSNYFPSRNTVTEVKNLAIDDLNTALTLMSASLNDVSKQTLTTNAVNAIKAKIALYFGDLPTARDAALLVINSGDFSIVDENDLASTFSTDSAPNSVFEVAANATDNIGINGLANIYRGTSYGDIVGLQDLVDIYDAGDVRGGASFISTAGGEIRNIGKYPTMNTFDDNISVIRYEEVVLIYAEAIMVENPTLALTHLNSIPSKRGATTYAAVTLDNILLERRKEFAFEGMRFHDLARTGKDIPLVDAINQTHGGVTYGAYNFAYPIPDLETGVNSNVVQNFGF